MRNFLILVIVLGTSLRCAGQSDRVSQGLIDLHKKKFSWLVNKNYDSLQVLLDENLLYIHSNGMTESKADVFNNLKNEVISYTRSDVTEAQVRVFGNSAIVTGTGMFVGKAKGTPFELTLSYTEVYVKNGARWKLVSRHACRLPA
jgi:hypothetical protein